MTAHITPDPVNVDAVRAIAALDVALRRQIYAYIRATREPVTREQTADAVGISAKLATFHLDKLVDVGLLAATYDTSRRAHRVGRTPKTYQPADTDVTVSIPERQPAVLADILIQAIRTARPDETAHDAALRTARQHGHELGASTRAQTRGGRIGAERALTLAHTALQQRGFEPYRPSPTHLRLHNCPFHPLAANAPTLVCAINHQLLQAFLTGLGAHALQAELTPRAGECCVELGPTPPTVVAPA